MKNKLMKYLPGYYRTSKVINNLMDSESRELEEFKARLDKTLNQFFVDLADTSLERWESELGIEVNKNKPLDQRRSVIKSKLRGSGTVTVRLIKNVSESFSNGEVDVIEENSKYSFTVKFVGVKGTPPNIEDLRRAIEEIKPAHLTFEFEYTYNTYDAISGFTYDELSGHSHLEIREVI